jgi:hypothetical protein
MQPGSLTISDEAAVLVVLAAAMLPMFIGHFLLALKELVQGYLSGPQRKINYTHLSEVIESFVVLMMLICISNVLK